MACKKAQPLPPRKLGADQHYKEFKIVAFYDETQDHRLVSGTRGDCEVAGRLMRREAGRIHLDRADEKVGNVDGSPWIRNQVQRQSLPLDALRLDFYHLSENVHKARREIFGEDDEGGKQWAGQLLHVFKHDGYEAAWKQLLEWRVALKRGRPAADRLVNYVSERREMIRYPEFQAKGWQLGSGPTEATCKTLTARLKGSGMRWDGDNAEAIVALEALTQSDQWDLSGKVSYGKRVEYARKFCHTPTMERKKLLGLLRIAYIAPGATFRSGMRADVACVDDREFEVPAADLVDHAEFFSIFQGPSAWARWAPLEVNWKFK